MSSGWTIASALKRTPGATIFVQALKSCKIVCASGRFWLDVPIFFHINATASSLIISIPLFAKFNNIFAISIKTFGLV